jgi:hypothetical protein
MRVPGQSVSSWHVVAPVLVSVLEHEALPAVMNKATVADTAAA